LNVLAIPLNVALCVFRNLSPFGIGYRILLFP
jgi:hypothetical protein